MLELTVSFVLGLLVGSLIISIKHLSKGTLRIDHSNPEKDVYRFEIDNLDGLSKKKRIVLKVDNKADLSQK